MVFHVPHYNWFGKGFKLRAAITIACQLAFVLFGYDQGKPTLIDFAILR
jgi:hypothetical protein